MSHQSEYESIKKQIAELEQSLKNRCIECSNFNKKKNECIKHGCIPRDVVYEKNDCPDYDFLPFKFVEL